MAAVIFVEGVADVKFISDYIKSIGASDSKVIPFKGKDAWVNMSSVVELQYKSVGIDKILFIFDADGNPAASRAAIIQKMAQIGINDRYEIFLLPNDADNGNLENLLIEISEPAYSIHHDCFDNYTTCVTSGGIATNVPSNKAKVYTFIDIMSQDPRDEKRDYINCGLFDLKHTYLTPLKDFLIKNT